MKDPKSWARDPSDIQMASDLDGFYTAAVSAHALDLDGWKLVAVTKDGHVVEAHPWGREHQWGTYNVPTIKPAWTADAEFVEGRWNYGLRSPDGEVFPFGTRTNPL